MDSPEGAVELRNDDGRTAVVWVRDGVVLRRRSPATEAVHAMLRHLESAGFAASPPCRGHGLRRRVRDALLPGG